MKPLDLTSIRKQNLVKVLDLMTFAPGITRQELAEAAGLSQMTVTNLVDLLKEQCVLQLLPVRRDPGIRPSQGRKADAISLSGGRKAWLLADISGSQFNLTLLGFDAAILKELHDNQQGEYLPRLEKFLQDSHPQILQALEGRELLGIAVVTPGPYDLVSDTVHNKRLPQLNGVRIKALFRRCFGDYSYYVDEDVKFAVRAFPDLIGSSRCEALYYLYIGEGVGGAAVHGGNMLRGLNATAGDTGQLPSGGATFENRLSTEAFRHRLGIQEPVPPEKLPELFRALAEDAPDLYAAALADMAAVTAEMLRGVLWILDPTHVVIDCVYALPRETVFLQAVRNHLQQIFAGENRVLPELLPCAASVSAVLRGAVRVLQSAWLDQILL